MHEHHKKQIITRAIGKHPGFFQEQSHLKK